MRILLAVDTLEVADLALQHFRLRPWPAGSTVEVLCVIDEVDLGNVPQLIEDLRESAGELATYTARKIGELGISSLATVLSGNPKDVIVDHAAETGADFILMAVHQEIGRRRFLLGSVAKAVLRAAHCSVELLRAPALEGETPRPLKVLLATDGSDCSLLAVRSVAGRPWPAGTEIRILSVVEPATSPMLHVPFPATAEEELRAQAMEHTQKAIGEAEELVTKAGLRTSESISVLLMKPESIIVSEAAQWEADLIVVGSHGRRGFNRLVLGSVSEGVALHGACSVEVVRARPARSHVEFPLRTPALAHS